MTSTVVSLKTSKAAMQKCERVTKLTSFDAIWRVILDVGTVAIKAGVEMKYLCRWLTVALSQGCASIQCGFLLETGCISAVDITSFEWSAYESSVVSPAQSRRVCLGIFIDHPTALLIPSIRRTLSTQVVHDNARHWCNCCSTHAGIQPHLFFHFVLGREPIFCKFFASG